MEMETGCHIDEIGNESIDLDIETYGTLIKCPKRSICSNVGDFYNCYFGRFKQSEPILERTNQTN